MNGEIERAEWESFIDEFSKRTAGRNARVEIFSEELGAQVDAEMIPLEGVAFGRKGSLASSLEIMLGGGSDRHLTHTVEKVKRILPKVGTDGREDALEIEAEEGTKTIIIFETSPQLSA